MSKLFDKTPVVPRAKEAPEGRPSDRTTRIGHALRQIKIEDEFQAGKRDSIANSLDRAITATNRKGDGIKTLYAYKQATDLYTKLTGKVWGL